MSKTKKILASTLSVLAVVGVTATAVVVAMKNIKQKQEQAKKLFPLTKIDETKIIKNQKDQPVEPKKTMPLGTIDPSKVITNKPEVNEQIDVNSVLAKLKKQPFIKLNDIHKKLLRVKDITTHIGESARDDSLFAEIYERLREKHNSQNEEINKELQDAIDKAKAEIASIATLSKVEQNEYNQMLNIYNISNQDEIDKIVQKAQKAGEEKVKLYEFFKDVKLSNYQTTHGDLSFTLTGDKDKIAKIKEHIESGKFGLKVYLAQALRSDLYDKHFDPVKKVMLSAENIVDADEDQIHIYTRLTSNNNIPPTTINFYNDEYKISVPLTTQWPEFIRDDDKEIMIGERVGTTREQLKEFEKLITKDYDYPINSKWSTNFNDVIKGLKEDYQKGGRKKDEVFGNRNFIFINKLLRVMDTLLHTPKQYVQYQTSPDDQEKYNELLKQHIETSLNEIFNSFELDKSAHELDTKISNLLNVQFMALSDLDTYKVQKTITETLADVTYSFANGKDVKDIIIAKNPAQGLKAKLEAIKWLVKEIFTSDQYTLDSTTKDKLLLDVIDKDGSDFDYKTELTKQLEELKKQ